MSDFSLVRNAIGEWPAYPGHPLVLALLIMEAFPDYAAASVLGEHGWCAALTDSRIPGSGCHVGAAIRVLAAGAQGTSVEEMIRHAADYWERGQAGGHLNNISAGRDQAHRCVEAFSQKAPAWFASSQTK